jgi:hypothetical protein
MSRLTRTGLGAVLLILCASGCGSSDGSPSNGSTRAESAHTNGSSAQSSATGPVAKNLQIPAGVRAELRIVLARVRESGLLHEQLGEAEKGTVFYAAFNGAHYAVATFDIPGRGTADQPSVFAEYGANGWVYGGDRLGNVATAQFLPCAVRVAWSARGCTAPAAAVTPHRAFIRKASMDCAGIGRQLGQATSYAGIARVSDSQIQAARALVGKVAAMRLTDGDRAIADQLLTLQTRLVGLVSYAVEARGVGNQQGWTNSFLAFQRVARQLGKLASTHGIHPCGIG